LRGEKRSPTLASYDEIFHIQEDTLSGGERIAEIPITDLYPPEYHPFLVLDDESMSRLTESVKQYGVREPGLARPRLDGGYELLCGNRRKRACELAGIPTMPVIIREMDDDSAVIAMVDSNLEQRETLLFSEKAWAYRVKLEALNHRGVKSENPGQLSVEVLCEQTGDSKNQIFRIVRLTELVPDLLDKVDVKKLAFTVAVELSYLSRTEQAAVVNAMAEFEIRPSLSQAIQLKKMSQAGDLTTEAIRKLLSKEKKPSGKLKSEARFRDYFPPGYSPEQMEAIIVRLLSEWKAGVAV
jgi:ParB family chromosome partitioning protein